MLQKTKANHDLPASSFAKVTEGRGWCDAALASSTLASRPSTNGHNTSWKALARGGGAPRPGSNESTTTAYTDHI